MLCRVRSSVIDYTEERVPISRRPGRWEFQACCQGRIAPLLPRTEPREDLHERTLWVFPQGHRHGWTASEPAERIVFHFTEAPDELEDMLPARGYYRVPLSAGDCQRLHALASRAGKALAHPTELIRVQSLALVSELSLIAFRETSPKRLRARPLAHSKTEQALAWYQDHIGEAPGLERVAKAVRVSPAHLRRLFHEATGGSPRKALMRTRMEMAKELIVDAQMVLKEAAPLLGFSDTSALSRAISTYFGISARSLRRRRNDHII